MSHIRAHLALAGKLLQSETSGFFYLIKTHQDNSSPKHSPNDAPARMFAAQVEKAQLSMPSSTINFSPVIWIVSYISGVIARACLCHGPLPPLIASSLLRQRPCAAQYRSSGS